MNSCLKKENIAINLRSQYIKKHLEFLTVDYVNNLGEYKSLQLVFNSSHIFTEKNIYLSIEKSELVSQIKSSINTYTCKEEYIANRPDLFDNDSVDKFIGYMEQNLTKLIKSVDNDTFVVRGVDFGWSPVCSVVINYNHNKIRQEPLVLLPHRHNYIENKYTGKDREIYKEFIEDIIDGRWDFSWV